MPIDDDDDDLMADDEDDWCDVCAPSPSPRVVLPSPPDQQTRTPLVVQVAHVGYWDPLRTTDVPNDVPAYAADAVGVYDVRYRKADIVQGDVLDTRLMLIANVWDPPRAYALVAHQEAYRHVFVAVTLYFGTGLRDQAAVNAVATHAYRAIYALGLDADTCYESLRIYTVLWCAWWPTRRSDCIDRLAVTDAMVAALFLGACLADDAKVTMREVAHELDCDAKRAVVAVRAALAYTHYAIFSTSRALARTALDWTDALTYTDPALVCAAAAAVPSS